MFKILKLIIVAILLSTNAIAGSDGKLELSKNSKPIKDCFEPLNRATFSFNHRSGEMRIPLINWSEPLRNQLDHFLDCIINKKQCLTDYDHARKVVSILEEASG